MYQIIQRIKQARVTVHSVLEAGSAQCCRRVLCCESVGWVSARRWELECYSAQTNVDGAKQSVARTMMNRRQADVVVAGYGSTLMAYKLVKATVRMPRKPSSGVTLLMVIVLTNAAVAIAIAAVTVGRVAISKTNFMRCRLAKWHSKASQRVWAH